MKKRLGSKRNFISALILMMMIALLQTFPTTISAASGNETSTAYTASNGFSSTQGLNQWYHMEGSGGVYTNLTNYDSGSQLWRDPNTYPFVGGNSFHPGTSASAVKKWVAPQNGSVDISGVIYAVSASSVGVNVQILKNNILLWSGLVTSSGNVTPTGVTGIPMKAGDAIYFVVSNNGSINYDYTQWDPTVTLTTQVNYQGTGYDSMSGITTGTGYEGPYAAMGDGSYLEYNNVNFRGGAYTAFQARVASTATGGVVKIRLDSATGPVIGTLTVATTWGSNTWDTQTTALAATTGVHDVYLTGVGGTFICNLVWFQLTSSAPNGATMPFTTYEAENAVLGGNAAISPDSAIAQAAVGRSYVYLAPSSDSIQFNNVAPATKLSIRYNVPQGAYSYPKLYVNGVYYKTLTLSYIGNYDTGQDSGNGRYFNEADVDVNLIGGENLKIQYDSGSSFSVDRIALEVVPAPLQMPANYLSVASCGALGNGVNNDTSAIQSCIDQANAANPKKGVWFPAGTYNVRPLTLPGGTVMRGAGLWYTTLYASTAISQTYTYLMTTTGDNISIQSMAFVSNQTRRHPDVFAIDNTHNYLDIENCRFDLFTTSVGGWGQNGSYGTFINLRIRETFADGIHQGEGGSNNLVKNVWTVGTGDDGIALVNGTNVPLASNNIVQFSTVEAVYYGRGISMTGNSNSYITDSIVNTVGQAAGIYIASESGTYNSWAVYNPKIRRNTVSYTNKAGNNQGALELWPGANPIYGALVELNTISKGATYGIKLDYWPPPPNSVGSADFNYNTVVTQSGYFPDGNFVQDYRNRMTYTTTGNTGF